MKKLAVLVICISMMFCLSVTAFAAGGDGSGGEIRVGVVVIGAIIGILIAVFVMLGHKSKLKSVHMQHAAANYIKPGSMKVTTSREIYLYKKVDRQAKPQNNN